MLYNIILKSKTSFLDRVFTYAYDKELKTGTRVVVPFGRSNSKNIGIIVDKHDGDIDFEAKEIVEVLDSKPIVSDELLKIAFFMIKNNISDYGSAINTILPPGSIDKVKEYYKAKDSLREKDKELYDFLDDYKDFQQISNEFKGKYIKSHINDLSDQGYLDSYISTFKKSSVKYLEEVSLLDESYKDKIRKNANKQLAILDYLMDKGKTEKSDLLELTSSNLSTLKSLIEKDLIKIEKKPVYRNVLHKVDEFKKIKFNDQQEKAYNEITESDHQFFLLHGVTGSGKTEVYLQLVEKYLQEGKEAIILVPEISLTPQTIQRFQGRFGDQIAVLHSKLSISQRADQWRMIKNKDVKIVVGARSAIFAPFENLGLVVIDEEHESSYRSDKNPKYSAIEIAKERAKYHGAKLVLGSATPSVKTSYEVGMGNIKVLNLKERVNNISLPQVNIVDMREELKSNNFSMLSKQLQEKIHEALKNNEQVILFLNKRGHSSFVFCRHCGYVHKCEACDVAMTYHKSKDRLLCHYCGRTAIKPKKCINCGSTWIKEYGAGTEMLEDEAKKLFPGKKIYRMDADTVTKREDYENVYKMMQDKQIDILIGTQMLAKGLDFPNISVVGIVSADISLNIPDFRAGEKTYDLITQVSGRAGRAHTEGNVFIQTYNPDNYAIVTSANNDYQGFYTKEMEERKLFNYPPFIKILNINLSSKDRTYGIAVGRKLTIMVNDYVRKHKIELVEITGPTPSLIERINNRYRFDIILKAHEKQLLLDIANHLRQFTDNKVYINFKLEEEWWL